MKTYLHINYYENCYTLSEAFEHASKTGCNGLEVRDRDRSGTLSLEEYLNLVTSLAKKHSLEVVYGCRVDTSNPDPLEREASQKHFHRVLLQTRATGTTTVNVFTGRLIPPGETSRAQMGSAIASEENWAVSSEMLSEAADAFPDLRLCLETHSGYIHDRAITTQELIDRIARPNVLANLDYINVLRHPNGETFVEALRILGPVLGYAHLKNVHFEADGTVTRTRLEDGDEDIKEQVRAISSLPYDGIISLENTMTGDKRLIAHADHSFLRDVLDKLNIACAV